MFLVGFGLLPASKLGWFRPLAVCYSRGLSVATVADIIKERPYLLKPTAEYERDLFDVPFKHDPDVTAALKALKTAKHMRVSEGELDFGYLETESSLFSDEMIGRNILFVRNFPPTYLHIFIHAKGWYFLVILEYPSPHFKPITFIDCLTVRQFHFLPPPEKFESTQGYSSQRGASAIQVMFLEEELAFTTEPPRSSVIESFHPESTEYLFEPSGLTNGVTEPFWNGLSLPIKAMCEPDKRRYKEFCKNGGVKAYMPCWTEEELVLAGRMLEDKGQVPEGMDYSEKGIRGRYRQFGGIIRHVLPSSVDYLEGIEGEQSGALKSLEAEKLRVLADFPEIERHNDYNIPISHYLMC